MARISSPILFSHKFGINPSILNDEGIFDPILNIDTKLFIDPLLLAQSSHKIIKDQAANELNKYYEDILSLLEVSTRKGDFAYNSAIKLMPENEIGGTCLGYGTNSISGRSISNTSKRTIINTADEIIKIGIKKPELFILLPLFEKGIGSDTISDITTFAIQKSLFEFTIQIARKLGIKTSKYKHNGEIIDIISNPLHKINTPILLLPQDILRKLPFASTWDEIKEAANANQELRLKFNKYISMLWKAKAKPKKEQERLLANLMKNKDGINTLIEIVNVNKGKITSYDFKSDEESLMFVQLVSEIIKKYPLELNTKVNTKEELKLIVKKIIKQFKFLIENKGINKLLWKDKTKPNNEKITQMIFLLVAYSYCEANDIDINPEMDAGPGYVDFKFSKGFSKKIIVEIKHSYNSNIIDGFSTQLKLYKKAEETLLGYYIVVDVGGMGKKLDKLYALYNDDINKKAEIIYVDGNLKPSASKRKTEYDVFDKIDQIVSDITDDFISSVELSDFNINLDDIFEDNKE